MQKFLINLTDIKTSKSTTWFIPKKERRNALGRSAAPKGLEEQRRQAKCESLVALKNGKSRFEFAGKHLKEKCWADEVKTKSKQNDGKSTKNKNNIKHGGGDVTAAS